MTDGTHRGAILDRDGEKLAKAKRLLDENKRLVDEGRKATKRADKLIEEAGSLNAASRCLVAEAKSNRDEAEKLLGEVAARQKSEAESEE